MNNRHNFADGDKLHYPGAGPSAILHLLEEVRRREAPQVHTRIVVSCQRSLIAILMQHRPHELMDQQTIKDILITGKYPHDTLYGIPINFAGESVVQDSHVMITVKDKPFMLGCFYTGMENW